MKGITKSLFTWHTDTILIAEHDQVLRQLEYRALTTEYRIGFGGPMVAKHRNLSDTPSDRISVESGLRLTDRNPGSRNHDGQTAPPQQKPFDQVPELLSALSLAFAAREASARVVYPAVVYREATGLCLGDVVRSTDDHWRKTHQHLTGSIVRFERVPERAISYVRSDHWAYLNSGGGPVSLAIIEKVPSHGKGS